MVLAILWCRWVEEKLDLCGTTIETSLLDDGMGNTLASAAGRSNARVEWGLVQVRLTINTVLSSISASSPFSRRFLSFCSAHSSNPLHISLAEPLWCSCITVPIS